MEDLDTELLGQLQRWHEEDQYQRIIDAIEAIPQPERGYELTCQLARAYNNLAGPEEAGPLESPSPFWSPSQTRDRRTPCGTTGWATPCSIWTVKRRPCPTSSGRQSWTPRTRMPLSSSASARSTSPPSSAVPRCTARRTGTPWTSISTPISDRRRTCSTRSSPPTSMWTSTSSPQARSGTTIS